MDGLVLLVCFIIYVFLSDWWLTKEYNIRRKKGILVKYANKTHKYSELILMIMIILGIFFLSKGIDVHYWLILYFISLFLIRSIVEWKYERERKEYILELNGFIAFIILAMIECNTFFL